MARQGNGYIEMDAAEFVDLPDFYNTVWDVEHAVQDLARELRLAQGLTQAQVAQRVGTTQSNVGAVENHNPRYGIELALKVACALGASRQQLGGAIAGLDSTAPPARVATRSPAAPRRSRKTSTRAKVTA